MQKTQQPKSHFERFVVGLNSLILFQPAAEVDVVGQHILVGDTEDPHITEGARKHLRGLGFFEDDTNKMFAFPTHPDG